ncbi:MAG: hypothetical protein ACOC80_13345 [Petrotogales bacterium]
MKENNKSSKHKCARKIKDLGIITLLLFVSLLFTGAGIVDATKLTDSPCLLISSDTNPVIDSFSVNPTTITSGESFTISYSVSDDIGLDWIELWRTTDNNGPDDEEWVEVATHQLSGKSKNGSFSDSTSAGSYWYGIHVGDTNGNWITEGNPINVVVNPPQTIDASMSDYSPNDPNNPLNVEKGKSTELSITFTNTGNTPWKFIAGATVWNSKGYQVANYEKTLDSPLQPGHQETVSWTHTVSEEGDYWIQFGVWKDKPYTVENLLDKGPSPSQRLIVGVPLDRNPVIDSFSVNPTTITSGESFTISYSVSDDIGLDWIELWRTTDNNGPDDEEWVEVATHQLSGKSKNGSFSDSTSAGSYWYGIHVGDTNGNWITEGNPINVVVNPPVQILELSIPAYGPKIQKAPKATELNYIIKIKNKGNEVKEVNLDITQSVREKWEVQLPPSVTLTPKQSQDVNLKIKVPENQPGAWNKITMKAQSLDKSSSGEISIFAEDSSNSNNQFGVYLNFPPSVYDREFMVPSFATKVEKENSVYVIFSPQEPIDLSNSNININIRDNDSNLIKSEVLEVKFSQHPQNIIDSSFDTKEDSYSFSNNDVPEEDRGRCIRGKCICIGCGGCDCEEGRCICEGKCYGMAATSLLYFTGELSLPENKNTYELEMSDALPNIDKFDGNWRNLLLNTLNKFGDNKMDINDYNTLKQNIAKGDPMIFLLSGGSGDDGDHAVVAYKIIEDESNKVYIQVYDPNWPLTTFDPANAFPYIIYDQNSKELSYRSYNKFKLAYAEPWYERIKLYSPASLCVYDSQGRVTGLLNGEVKEEIPYSEYDIENETAVIYFSYDSYQYEVVGTAEGDYGLTITSIKGEEETNFTLKDVPTVHGTVHQFNVNWSSLSQDQGGVTLKIDYNGDGRFEENKTLASNSTETTTYKPITPTSPPPEQNPTYQPTALPTESSSQRLKKSFIELIDALIEIIQELMEEIQKFINNLIYFNLNE